MKTSQTKSGRNPTISQAEVYDLVHILLERAQRLSTDPPPVSKRVREARDAAGLSQEEAARRLHLSLNAYRAYETFREPKPTRLRQIAVAFGLPEDYFLAAAPLTSDERQLDRIEEAVARLADLIEGLLEREYPPKASGGSGARRA